jgi:hypothetical protein
MIYTLRSENKMETVNDAVTIDIDGDGEKEIVAVTYFGGLYILKRIEVYSLLLYDSVRMSWQWLNQKI